MYKKLKLNRKSLKEDDNEKLEDIVDTEENQEDMEDIVDTEEEQEENSIEEEGTLEDQLDELRDILVDLDLRLYQVISKEDKNNIVYIIGKVAENSDDILMLVDNKVEEISDDKEAIWLDKNGEEVKLKDLVDTEEELEEDESEEVEIEDTDSEESIEDDFDFVALPNSFEEINELNPRYGKELTPNHERIKDYLMSCLIEVNPDAAEELNNEEDIEDEEVIDIEGGDINED